MCGIVGLFLKNERLKPELGRHLSNMLATMSARGPDSAGIAVYGSGSDDGIKLTLRAPEASIDHELGQGLRAALGAPVGLTRRASHLVVTVPRAGQAQALAFLRAHHPDLHVVSIGSHMEIYKEVGLPERVAGRFEVPAMQGTHGIGHTRMATESAVTTDGAHPFSTGEDQCLVHNGSLSNHNALRRNLQREGFVFETQNDSEVAAGYLTWRMREGDSLKQALTSSLDALDGFFTFVVGTESGFGVLRDPIACKPAVMAETEQWVAFGTEYRALVDLPGVENAEVWEPEPARVYRWERH
jgi:methylamine---glutamate N-methyltransferase subunit A